MRSKERDIKSHLETDRSDPSPIFAQCHRPLPPASILLRVLGHELMLLRDSHALGLLSLSGVHLRRHALLSHVCSMCLRLRLRLSVVLLRLLLGMLGGMRVVERRRGHCARGRHWVRQLAGGEVRVLERLGGGNALCRIELQKTFEQVNGLRRCFREDLREGDLGVTWVLLGLLLIVGFSLLDNFANDTVVGSSNNTHYVQELVLVVPTTEQGHAADHLCKDAAT